MNKYLIIFIMILLAVFLISGIGVVPQGYGYVIEIFGKYKETWRGGLHWRIPLITKVTNRVLIKEQPMMITPFPVSTKDKVTLMMDMMITYVIFDLEKFTYGSSDAIKGLSDYATLSIVAIIGNMDFEQIMNQTEVINREIENKIKQNCFKWGIQINECRIKNIEPPNYLKESMNRLVYDRLEQKRLMIEQQMIMQRNSIQQYQNSTAVQGQPVQPIITANTGDQEQRQTA